MEIALFWFIGAVVVGIIAGSRARSGFGWFFLAVLFSPLLMGILVLVLPTRAHVTGAAPAIDAPDERTHVRCPDCRELVRADARKCKHCGIALVPVDLTSRSAAERGGQLLGQAARGMHREILIVVVLVLAIAGLLWLTTP